MAAAREARYGLLCAAARRHGAIAVLTGHTATDQAETRAMRQARSGATMDAGMADAVLHTPTGIWILRPFLSLTRQDLRLFLSAKGEGWIDDPSNADPRYERARLRLAADPETETETEAQTIPPVLREEQSAQALLAAHLHLPSPRVARLSPAFLADLTDPAAQRALFTLARIIGGRLHGPGRAAEERILAFLAAGTPGRRTAARTVFDRRRDGLWLYRESRDLPTLTLPPRATGLWDKRIRLENCSAMPLTIGPAADIAASTARLIAAGVPPAIARRAAPAEPDGIDGAILGGIPVLAPWDTFLPRFDLTIAGLLAERMGLPPIPPPPAATN